VRAEAPFGSAGALPPPEEFLWQYVRRTPLAAAVAEIDEEHPPALTSPPGICTRSRASGPWHGLRRKFAYELRWVLLEDLAELGRMEDRNGRSRSA
jgi:hypothetical protein